MLYPVHGLGPGQCQASIGGPRQDRVTAVGRLAEEKQKEDARLTKKLQQLQSQRPIRMPIQLGVGSPAGSIWWQVWFWYAAALAQASW